MTKILLIGNQQPKGYPGVFFNNIKTALSLAGYEYDTCSNQEDVSNFPNYDLYFGVGDELLRRKPQLVATIKQMGGTTVDFRTKKLPNKPKVWMQSAFQPSKYKADYVFTHMQDARKNCFYVGQGFDPKYLYPEHDDYFTVLVDHYMPKRRARVQQILDQCEKLFNERKKVRIWYHNHDGIVENLFEASSSQYQAIPFENLTAYYRKTHVFLPTHRETQGIVAAEIGHCGGLTLLEPWMYPKKTIQHIPCRFYRGAINWPEKVDFQANSDFTKKHYSIESFSKRIDTAIKAIS
ncbi:MAG: hypothetical protein AB8B49_05000 [Nitratireductor sp.]